jgi:diguanylate cyclase (GGDEF)-like protein/PAS domain S-box-containing protein
MKRVIEMDRVVWRTLKTAGLAVSFFLIATASIKLTRFNGGVAFLWPATAPLFAFLAVRPARTWLGPMVATGVASWVASSLFGIGPLAGIPLSLAIVSEGALGALILRRDGNDPMSFDGLRSLGVFVLAAGLVAPALSGVLGAGVIAMHTHQAFWPNWQAWFAAHSLGTISVAPLLLLVFRGEGASWYRGTSSRHKIEAALLLTAVTVTSFCVFGQERYPLLFLPMLPLIISTFRLGRLGATSSVLIVMIVGGILTLHGHGPIGLMQGSVGTRAQFFQFYLAVAVMIVLPAATELRRRETLAMRLRQSETTYRLLAENLGDTLIHTNLAGDVLYCSPAIRSLTGFGVDEVVGRNSRDFVLSEDFALFTASRFDALSEPERTIALEYRAKVSEDRIIWCETRMRSYTNDGGIPVGIILVVRDVTDRKAAEAELVHEAITDELTGIPNRKAFLSRLEYLQKEVAAGRGVGCVAIFDIDFFKAVNDRYGHATGDSVLKIVAKAAAGATRSGDMIARIGGEEFAIVLWGAAIETAAQTCERVRKAIEGCVTDAFSGEKVRVTASFGAAEIRRDADSGAVCRAADEALYAAKAAGRNRLRLAA